MSKRSSTSVISLVVLLALLALLSRVSALQSARDPIRIDNDDIGGVVNGPRGPEAGVWVIAETRDLPTAFAKIVVTDEGGRYLLPDLPKANYSVWVRGYGLVDSPKVQAAPGRLLNLTAVRAPTAAAAARYYPPVYWFSMLRVPEATAFPLERMPSQAAWLNVVKSGACQSCHALGTPGTRTMPKEFGNAPSAAEAWARRLRAGQASSLMARDIGRLDTDLALRLFGDWTDRIAGGELPFANPERPQAIARNVVITLWDWGSPTAYLHDEIATDRRNPRVNANGRIYGSPEDSTDFVPILDPARHAASEVLHPVRDPNTPSTKANPMAPSAYWGAEPIWDSKTLNHNPMMDERGRVWFTPRVRPDGNPAFCKQGSTHPSARVFPLEQSNRHLSMYDPVTGKFTLISTCFPTHHLNFAEDTNHTLWTSSGVAGPGVLGWLNRKMFEETGDEVEIAGMDPLHPRHQREREARCLRGTQSAIRPREGHAGRRESLLGRHQPDRRRRVGNLARSSRSRGSRRPGIRPDAHRAHRNLRAAASRLRAARRRCGPQRRVLGVALQRASRKLRPPEVQGAQRPDRNGGALRGGLDAPPVAGTAVEGRQDSRQRRGELHHLGGLVRYVRARQERPDCDGQPQ